MRRTRELKLSSPTYDMRSGYVWIVNNELEAYGEVVTRKKLVRINPKLHKQRNEDLLDTFIHEHLHIGPAHARAAGGKVRAIDHAISAAVHPQPTTVTISAASPRRRLARGRTKKKKKKNKRKHQGFGCFLSATRKTEPITNERIPTGRNINETHSTMPATISDHPTICSMA